MVQMIASRPEAESKEDPEFPRVLAKARAKAKGITYKPEIHGPFEDNPIRRSIDARVKPDEVEKLDALLERFKKLGEPRDRPDVRRMAAI